MRRAIHTCLVQVPAETVWDFLADFDNLMRIGLPDGTSRLLEGRRGTPRSRYQLRNFFDGVRASCIAVLEEADRPRTLVWKAKVYGGTGKAIFELAEVEDDLTAVRLTLEHTASAGNGPLEAFAWGLIEPNYQRLMRNLPAHCA